MFAARWILQAFPDIQNQRYFNKRYLIGNEREPKFVQKLLGRERITAQPVIMFTRGAGAKDVVQIQKTYKEERAPASKYKNEVLPMKNMGSIDWAPNIVLMEDPEPEEADEDRGTTPVAGLWADSTSQVSPSRVDRFSG